MSAGESPWIDSGPVFTGEQYPPGSGGGGTVMESAETTGSIGVHVPSQSFGRVTGCAPEPPGHALGLADS